MSKLSIGTFQKIDIGNVKRLLNKYHKIEGIKEYIRDYIAHLLREDNKYALEQDDFDLLESYTDTLVLDSFDFPERLKESHGWVSDSFDRTQRFDESPYKMDYSLLSLEKILYGCGEIFVGHPCVQKVLKARKEKCVEAILKLCKDFQEFKRLCDNPDIRELILKSGDDRIPRLIKLYNIQTVQEFEAICKKLYIKKALLSYHSKILETVFKLAKTSDDFEKICVNYTFDNHYVESFLKIADLCKSGEIGYQLTGCFHIDTFEKFETLCTELYGSLPAENFGFLMGLYNAQTIQEFNSLCKNRHNTMQEWSYKNLDRMAQLYRVDTAEQFEFFCENEHVIRFLNNHPNGILNEIVVSLAVDPREFETFSDTFPVRDDYDWLPTMVNFLNIKTLQEFSVFCNTEGYTVLCKISEADIYDVLGIFSENTANQLLFAKFLYQKIFPSRHNTKILFKSINHIQFKNFESFFVFYLENKQKSVIPMLEMLRNVHFLNLDLPLNDFKTFDDFRGSDGIIQKDDLRKNFDKLLQLNKTSDKNREKHLRQFDNCLKANNISSLEKLLMENLLKYVEDMYHRKFKIKIAATIGKQGDQGKSENGEKKGLKMENQKIDRFEFIEAFRMSIKPKHNKRQIEQLLYEYLSGKFDDPQSLSQYRTTKNKKWLKKNLTKEQQRVWLSSRRKEVDLNDSIDTAENAHLRIHNHQEVAISKIQAINMLGFDFDARFDDAGKLINYFNSIMKKEEFKIKEKDTDNLFEDLNFQINSIQEQFTTKKSKKVSKVVIERELDPLNCLMMGNWVDGSCLSFYSSVGNYYSAISNTIDVNKGVYYLRDENGNILGRCLLTIGQDKKLSRYSMYFNGNISAPLDEIFNEYTREIAKELGLKLNGNQDKVANIECDKWYKDGVQNVC